MAAKLQHLPRAANASAAGFGFGLRSMDTSVEGVDEDFDKLIVIWIFAIREKADVQFI
jgi:hypothetical protein